MAIDVSRIKAICFDVDGTLSDTDDMWVSQFTKRMDRIKFLFPNKDIVPFARWSVMVMESPGNLVYELFDRLHLDDDVAGLYSKIAKSRLGKKPKQFWLIPRGEEMLHHLKLKYPLAVVSARDAHGTGLFLEQFFLHPIFTAIATSQTCIYTKPFPDPVVWAAQQMQVKPEECLMVGDTTVDIRAGKSAGAQTVGVLCGFGTERELRRAGADLILSTTHELLDYLG
jgi:HAD superfamily hydrolase (TIGR01549 family)